MRIVVVANHASGVGDADRRGRIAAAFAACGVGPDIRMVAGADIGAAARAAVEEAPDRVVAAGGDGTVGTVAGVLAGTGVAMGILPLGTWNHFAKDAGVPLDPRAAAAALVEGAPRPVDVAEVNGRVFVNNASIGVYPRAVRERELRRRWLAEPKHLAMARACLSVLRRVPSERVRLTVDGRAALRTTPFVFVGNNVYEAGLLLGKRTSLQEGVLGLYHTRRTGRWGLVALAARAVAGRLDGDRSFEAVQAREVVVDAGRRAVPLALDGELVRMVGPLRFRTRPAALLLAGGSP